ncbi:hypothetical protein E4Z66_02050 [Aliishimia ponticola]|uniref:Uncharacterized protein n=1 Tax=Aliishimia ponticola TaxID=2499833 RepID=A0A4S4NFK2_9RHOB|nr:hypothetical protein [Aliishimia ponticola]THH38376.1 hypothetical protein E4Z66_02050 [Aliishimia ponticola]
MFTRLKLFALAASVSAGALVQQADATEGLKFSEIDVEASYSAASDSNALKMFPDIENDVQKAIAQRVATSDNANDPEISVDIRKIALDGDTYLPDSAEFNEIEGVVNITAPNGATGGRSFPISIAARSGDEAMPAGVIVIPPSDREFYQAMVNAFADGVADGVLKVGTLGDTASN